MVVISAGIRPRDELARDCGLEVGTRGGVVIDDEMQTSDSDVYAVGEVASHRDMVYGLVAPGYDMAETLATNLCGGKQRFHGGDLSAKLKLMGVDVASFGDYEAGEDRAMPMAFEDPFQGVYKKLLFDLSGEKLLGGILVGDAGNFSMLQALANADEPLTVDPSALLGVGSAGAEVGGRRHAGQCPGVFL